MNSRRSYGTGSLMTKANARGALAWYGRWRDSAGAQVTRRLGLVRQPGATTGLTEKGAEKALRTRMENHIAVPKAAHDEDGPMTFTRADVVYRRHVARQGRKRSTIVELHIAVPPRHDPPRSSSTSLAVARLGAGDRQPRPVPRATRVRRVYEQAVRDRAAVVRH